MSNQVLYRLDQTPFIYSQKILDEANRETKRERTQRTHQQKNHQESRASPSQFPINKYININKHSLHNHQIKQNTMEYPQHQPSPAAVAPTNSPTQAPVIDVDTKILSDLAAVTDKITLCQSMLVNIQHTSEIDSNESLLSIIGFLEACVPRVRELIDVGMTALKEETLTKCFQVNDDLCKILDDVEHPEKVTTASTTSAVAPAAATAATKNDDTLDSLEFDAFGFEDKKRAVADSHDGDVFNNAKAATTPTAASALEDLLAPPTSTLPVSTAATATKPPAVDENDDKEKDGGDFDDFVGKRVTSSNSFSIDE